MRHFANFIDSYVSYTRNQETPEKVHRWTAISILAGALERKVTLNRGYYTLFPNLYVFVIGASGIVRKSTSTGIGVDLLRNLDKFNLMSERVTAASLIAQIERACGRYIADGVEHSQAAVYCYASELNVFLNEIFGSISELLTTFYDCSPHDDSKPWVYENKGDGKISIYGPCLNILGASTPTWLARSIPIAEQEGGFSSRVVFVVETDPPRKFIAWPEVDPAMKAMRPKLIADLQHVHELAGAMTVTDEARAWGTDWYKTHQLSIIKRQEARFAGYFGRKFETVLKVAMILSVAESDALVIRPEHMEHAATLLNELEQSMFDAFGVTGKQRNVDETRKVVEVLRSSPEPVPHSILLRAMCKDLDHKTLVDIMQTLHNMKAVRVLSEGTTVLYQLADAGFRF